MRYSETTAGLALRVTAQASAGGGTQAVSERSVYDRLGVRRVINAAGTKTRVGGTLMLPEVVDAMVDASHAFVKMEELQQRAGAIIAEVTGAEAGYVTAGAAAGLLLAAAACIAGTDPSRIHRLPDAIGIPNQVIIQKGHRMDYDKAVRTAGAEIVEIGFPGETMPWELEAAITEHTAAVLHVVNRPAGPLPLPQVTEIAHRHGIPVIVDAAAALPPAENLRRFIAEGADLVVFSGGKALRGPQASGVLAGRASLIRSVVLQHQDMDVRESTWTYRDDLQVGVLKGRPFHGIGRPLKVGKEEIVGLLVALRAYVSRDHSADALRWQKEAMALSDGVNQIKGLRATILPEYAGRPMSMVRVDVEPALTGMTAIEVVNQLDQSDPAVCVDDALVLEGAFLVNPFSLQDGEPELILGQLKRILEKVTV